VTLAGNQDPALSADCPRPFPPFPAQCRFSIVRMSLTGLQEVPPWNLVRNPPTRQANRERKLSRKPPHQPVRPRNSSRFRHQSGKPRSATNPFRAVQIPNRSKPPVARSRPRQCLAKSRPARVLCTEFTRSSGHVKDIDGGDLPTEKR